MRWLLSDEDQSGNESDHCANLSSLLVSELRDYTAGLPSTVYPTLVALHYLSLNLADIVSSSSLAHSLNTMPGRTRPIEKFAEATAKCGPQGAVYGKCIAANYKDVHKNMCAKEFAAFKDCYLKTAGRRH
nr:hypothetical protein CFP56_28780 [Quercus suber]